MDEMSAAVVGGIRASDWVSTVFVPAGESGDPTETVHAGPLPAPSVLAEYESLVPGSAAKFINAYFDRAAVSES
jgi:hypothetical protein